jgi:tRNA 2-thiouridine synthesizing protein A
MSGESRLVDARGMLCPWPVIRLGRAAREMGGVGTVRILADDPIAPAELAKLCAERGWRIAPDPAEAHAFAVEFG